MNISLTKPLCFFDIEATGLNVIRDRILQLAIVKYLPDSESPLTYNEMINPGIPISEDAIKVHGITPAMVANKPTFAQKAKEIADFIGDSDMAGYNSNRFDLPILLEEFARVGIDFNLDNRNLVDVQRIFYRMEPRTLGAAYKFYCDRKLENAHDALADVEATAEVLFGQIEKYKNVDLEIEDGILKNPVQPDVEALSRFSSDLKMIDVTQRLKYNADGVVVFNFGKNIGKPVAQTLYNDRQYYQWMLNKEFSSQVKKIIRKLVGEYEQKLKKESD